VALIKVNSRAVGVQSRPTVNFILIKTKTYKVIVRTTIKEAF
jgi:hypothetical protein